MALGCVGLQFPGRLPLSLAALALWLAALAGLDRGFLPRLWRPRFLALSALVALASGMLLGRRDAALFGVRVSTSGLLAGALMVARGTLLWALTLWGSAQLTSGALVGLGGRLSGGAFSTAVVTALRLVPDLTEGFERRWREARAQGQGRLSVGITLAARVVCETSALAERLAREPSPTEPSRKVPG